MNTIDKINSLQAIQKGNKKNQPKDGEFLESLNKALKELNKLQEDKDKAMTDIATGKVKNLAQAAIAIDKAEIALKAALEIRNKAIQAYKEILRTQV